MGKTVVGVLIINVNDNYCLSRERKVAMLEIYASVHFVQLGVYWEKYKK